MEVVPNKSLFSTFHLCVDLFEPRNLVDCFTFARAPATVHNADTNQNTNSVGYPTVNPPVSPSVPYLVPQACCPIEALVFQQEYSA